MNYCQKVKSAILYKEAEPIPLPCNIRYLDARHRVQLDYKSCRLNLRPPAAAVSRSYGTEMMESPINMATGLDLTSLLAFP